MITRQEAYILAEKYLADFDKYVPRQPGDAFKTSFGEVYEFTACYYFYFKFVQLNGEEFDEPPIAGPNGFTISKTDGTFTVMSPSHECFEQEEKRMDDFYQLLHNIQRNKGGLDTIKSMYQLNSKQLLLFREVLQTASFNRTTATDIVNKIVEEIKTIDH